MTLINTFAPGWPGISPRWTSSAKSGVGTSLNPASRVWFTLSHGIFNEIYYPRLDRACVRDLGFIVTDGVAFFSEEKRHCQHEITYLMPAVPAYHLTNTCSDGRYQITKDILTDPHRDVVWQHSQFSALTGTLSDYHLHVLLAPHLGNRGADNTAWIGDFKGVPMLFAAQGGQALALACTYPWLQRSAGFVGYSDGWQDLQNNKSMTWSFERAENGNVALTGEIDLEAGDGCFDLALGFGLTPNEAGHRARAALLDGFSAARQTTFTEWQDWQGNLPAIGENAEGQKKIYKISTAVMKIHAGKRFPGGVIASLSIPWGFAKGDDDLGGYHLVWPRDLVETTGGLLAAGALVDAHRVLEFLQITQEADGHWPQNMWLDGTPYWRGLQIDETAFSILLVDLALREGALGDDDLDRFWPMVRKAAQFVLQNGPVSQQDRWEEDPGYSPFTLAVEIAALLVAAGLAVNQGEVDAAGYLRQTADAWNASIEQWTYVTGTDLADEVGVDGYYVRIAPPETADASSPVDGFVPIKNRPPGQNLEPARHIVSPDALALVRFGLRSAVDPRIVNTIKVIDTLLKSELPAGSSWHRYNDDGYGEHENGDPFDGTGIGRAWPLLTGERGHYELAAGHKQRAQELLNSMAAFANEGGFLPEQIWDAEDIPEKELFLGRSAGSAMPLVWAHAEYVKLCRSLSDGVVFDMPPQTVKRYVEAQTGSQYAIWRFSHKRRTMPAEQTLRLELLETADIHWSSDGWQTSRVTHTRDTGLGLHIADLDTTMLTAGTKIEFALHWLDNDRWQEENSVIKID